MNEKNLFKDLPETEVSQDSRISIIWVVPLIAALIGLWLVYFSYMQKGLEITISFNSGEGIVKRETLIKYGGVNVGVVDDIELSEDKENVVVTATLNKSAADLAKEGTIFWVVRPRLNLGGVSGLDTLLTGEYIKMRPGKGKPQKNFIGLDQPPFGDPEAAGLHITLESNRLGSLSEGSPVLFREIEVGRVDGHKLSVNEKNVQIHVFIYEKFVSLVRENTKFWNASGISITGGISGLKIRTESLASVLAGGIAFETPETEKPTQPCQNGAVFKLYETREAAMEGGFTVKIRFNSGEGLIPGSTNIQYKGLVVGKVTDIDIAEDLKGVIVSTSIKEAAAPIAVEGTLFWIVRPRLSSEGVSGINTLFSGQYIEVRPGRGEPYFSFTGLEKPPIGDPDSPGGLHLILTADNLGSISEGAPVYYKKIKVGEIHDHELSEDKKIVMIHLYIYEKYAPLVKTNTRFWNVSGIHVTAGLSGIKVKTQSIAALLDGGVAFETPETEGTSEFCQNGTVFQLYGDYESAMEGGIPITISFKDGKGLESNNTLIKFQGMVVGKVKSIRLNEAMDGVVVHALLNKVAENLARKGSYFWVERPKLSIEGVSGLSTLLSGEYIEVRQGKGEPQFQFTGLEEPPADDPTAPGLHIVLNAKQLYAFKIGNPVLYKDFQVGRIEGFEIKENGKSVYLNLFIYEKYAFLVKKTSRFWNAGGVDVKADLSGIEVSSKPLSALLFGAIAFNTPETCLEAERCESGTIFRLYDNFQNAMKGEIPITISFQNGNGLKENQTWIKFKGTIIGQVKTIVLNTDRKGVVVNANLFETYMDFARTDSQFWLVKPQIGIKGISGLDTLIAGPYIEGCPGSGEPLYTFTGLSKRPENVDTDGLKIILFSDKLGSLYSGAPVYYRQIHVGEVADYTLSKTSDKIRIEIQIEPLYAPLVRQNSKFWRVSGVDINVKLTGVEIKTESLTSLVSGGIAFATPENKEMGHMARENDTYQLYNDPKSKWLKWRPEIDLSEKN
ncbi:MAG: MCE family protein [Proteobacteria bacterium]|nr:MCE family protein [Pseudomonadota bacterium]